MEVRKATPQETAKWLVDTYDNVAPVTPSGNESSDVIAVLKIAARLADFVATQYNIGDKNE